MPTKEEIKTRIQAKKAVVTNAALDIRGEVFDATMHKDALAMARHEGADTSQVDTNKEGLLRVSDGRLLTRQEADKEFGVIRSEDIDKQFEGWDKPLIVVVTQDYSGIGFAVESLKAGYPTILAINSEEEKDLDKLLKKRTSDPKDIHKIEELRDTLSSYHTVGTGLVPKMRLEKVIEAKERFRNAYFFWDGNHSTKEGEMLRNSGFKVLGGSEFTHNLEKDRKYGTDIAKKAGVNPPPTFEFKDKQKGLDFLDQNLETAYVFKPDDGAGTYTTYVPDAVKKENANRELYSYIKSQDGDTGTYILQERKDGLEINIEYWAYKGVPFLCHANFECKRKENHDEGEMVGCAQDVEFIVPIDCKIAKETIAKLLKLPEFKNYTGPLDMNLIISDNEYYFLEYCCRAGYHATPNLIINLCLLPFPEVLIKWIDGDVKDMEKHFRAGFGVSVGLRIGHPKKGLPVYVGESVKFYHYDQFQRDGELFLSGYGNEVGIVLANDVTIQRAGERVLLEADKINYPMHACRTDIDLENYESSPRLRKEAADAMKLFDVV